jgi:hypothetical protein
MAPLYETGLQVERGYIGSRPGLPASEATPNRRAGLKFSSFGHRLRSGNFADNINPIGAGYFVDDSHVNYGFFALPLPRFGRSMLRS